LKDARDSRDATDYVGEYYDQLDRTVRSLADARFHHGLWLPGTRTRREAKDNLVYWISATLQLRQGQRCVDIGSGYGGTARLLASSSGVAVDAITNSRAQHGRAASFGRQRAVSYHYGDWLLNSFASETFDAAWAVECAEHVSDLPGFLRECHRVLRPGGALLVLSWLRAPTPSAVSRSLLLRPIASAGHLEELRTSDELAQASYDSGFCDVRLIDLSMQVRRTWMPTLSGIIDQLLGYLGVTYRTAPENEPGLYWVTLRIALAYWTGALQYTALVARKACSLSSDSKPFPDLTNSDGRIV
jgi:tocopherol O-methyltransferase